MRQAGREGWAVIEDVGLPVPGSVQAALENLLPPPELEHLALGCDKTEGLFAGRGS
jgi:hypothetical protein